MFCAAPTRHGDIPEPDPDPADENADIPDPEVDGINELEENAHNQFDIVSGPRSQGSVTLGTTLRKYYRISSSRSR